MCLAAKKPRYKADNIVKILLYSLVSSINFLVASLGFSMYRIIYTKGD